jgi:hypothetical protein
MNLLRHRAIERVVLATGLLAALLACKKSGPSKQSPTAAASASAAAAADAEADKDAQMSEKVGHYVTCLNRASGDVIRSKQRYLGWVDEKTGPTGKERAVSGLYSVHPENCLEALKKAAALSVKLPEVDPLAPPYQQALEALVPLLKDADEYYTRGNYKDDKWAKAKSMHGPLMAGFARFQSANSALDTKVSVLNDQLSARRLARLAKDPTLKLPYLFEKASVESKKLVRIADVESLKQVDLANLTQAVTTYEKTLDELTAYANAHKAEADKVTSLSSFQSESKDFLVAAKELMRRKRDNKDFAKEFGSPEHVSGHPAQVLSKYNRMVDTANSVRFRD